MSTWSNRKAAVQAEAEAEAEARQEALVATQQAALAEKSEEDVLAELDLPNPDEMQAGDDFSAFMKSTVPAALRNRALRQLWASNPALANVDMLVDYGEDYTLDSKPGGLIKTVYRVGKGMVDDLPEMPEAAAVPAVDESQSDRVEVYVEAEVAEAAVPAPEETPSTFTPRRRMRFEFGEGEMPAPARTERL